MEPGQCKRSDGPCVDDATHAAEDRSACGLGNVRDQAYARCVVSQWVVAGAEIALACGTVYLAVQARNEARAVGRESAHVADQVTLQREQMAAGTRPVVIPISPPGWSDGSGAYHDNWFATLPVKNVGPGAALNVLAWLDVGPPAPPLRVETVRSHLGAGDTQDLTLIWTREIRSEWQKAEGFVYFDDITGARWQTRFSVYLEANHRRIVVEHPVLIRDAGGNVVG
jgi:hypothetical protein